MQLGLQEVGVAFFILDHPLEQVLASGVADFAADLGRRIVLAHGIGFVGIIEFQRSEERRVGKECRCWWVDWFAGCCSSNPSNRSLLPASPTSRQILAAALYWRTASASSA